MHILTKDIIFPDVTQASSEGLLAIGGDLSVDRLVLAYKSGIFPWFELDEPILWWSPDPRFVVFPEHLKVSKSMRSFIKKHKYTITQNKAFNEVVVQCAQAKRANQDGTWITNEMIKSYRKLHDLGYAKSLEVWDESKLIAGLYGIDLGNNVFCGESMFTKVSNASKLAFIHLVNSGQYKLIDCQVHTNHLESLGAEFISRKDFLKWIN